MSLLGGCASLPTGDVVPTLFDHDRIFVVASAADGTALKFYTDSGGGADAIRLETARRLALAEIGSLPGDDEGDRAARVLVAFPPSMLRAGIPPPVDDDVFKGGLWSAAGDAFPFESEGFLGSRWFRDRVWEIDYPRRTLRLLREAPKADAAHRVALGFQTDERGRRTTNFARMAMTVDGEALDMLFDTGATAAIGARSAPVFALPVGSLIGTSFITKSVFERWTGRHPDWRVIATEETAPRRESTMIEVPQVSIAGHVVGPVWFAQRPDTAFHQYMASMMDQPVEGALGGSAFRYFKVTIDYPAAVATFER